jgi:hypothetical protein
MKTEAQPHKGRTMIMKALTLYSTKIFCALLDRLDGRQHLKIMNEPFMPLTIERIGEIYGQEGSIFSLCHYYEQNGDLVQDPEMCFIVVDQREKDKTAFEKVMIVPYLYQQANLGIFEESMTLKNNAVANCDNDLQLEHVVFANQWLKNIEQQGFLK